MLVRQPRCGEQSLAVLVSPDLPGPALTCPWHWGSSVVILVGSLTTSCYPGSPLGWLERLVRGQFIGVNVNTQVQKPQKTPQIFKLYYVVTHRLLKRTFSLTETIRKTDEYRGSLIQIFEFVTVLKTLGNQDLLDIPNLWSTYQYSMGWAFSSLKV